MIAIKDTEMPKCCDECDFIQRGDPDWCDLRVSMHDIFDDKIRPDWCPIYEIVQCKDCKHSEHWYSDKCLCYLWSETGIDVFDDGYCSYGERRKENR